MFSFHRTWSWRLLSANEPTLDYNRFRVGWLAYTELIDVPSKYFECPECKLSPQIIICDGICLSYPLKFMNQPEPISAEGQPLDGSR